MTALFPQKYTGKVSKIITLDNRKMALPRDTNLKVFTLRSGDQPADEGVLLTLDEQKRFNIAIIKLPSTTHNDVNNRGTLLQQKEIISYISDFLNI